MLTRIHDYASTASNAVGIAVAGPKLQSPIQLDTAAASNAVEIAAGEGELDAAAVSS